MTIDKKEKTVRIGTKIMEDGTLLPILQPGRVEITAIQSICLAKWEEGFLIFKIKSAGATTKQKRDPRFIIKEKNGEIIIYIVHNNEEYIVEGVKNIYVEQEPCEDPLITIDVIGFAE